MLNLLRILMSSGALCLLLGLSPSVQAEEWTTEEVFARHKDAVVQVRIIDTQGGAKRSIGSGFLVSDDGLLITNFHVVADFVHHPGQYRAEWFAQQGVQGQLELIDVDVVHDLALMRGPELKRPFLAVESNLPNMGERIFSLGFPYDLGLTIVEGTFNGLLEKSLYERIHLTASINPGMSGGPAIDRFGNVIGVNVATAGNQVSFLVPSKYVIALLTRAQDDDKDELMARIGRQLIDNQQQYLGALLQAPFTSTDLGPYKVPAAIANYVNCWSQTDQANDRLYDHTQLACQTDDDVFLSESLSTGSISYTHELKTARDIGSLRFWSLLESSFDHFYGDLGGDKDSVTNFECQVSTVAHGELKRKLVFCLRAYREFPGLYDIVQRQVSLQESRSALESSLVLTGVSMEQGVAFARRFAESIEWTP